MTKLVSRKAHGLLRKTSSWSLTFKNMAQAIGEQFLLIQVNYSFFLSFFFILLFYFILFFYWGWFDH